MANLGHEGRRGDVTDGKHEVMDPIAGGVAEGAEAGEGGADEALRGRCNEGGLADLAQFTDDVAWKKEKSLS